MVLDTRAKAAGPGGHLGAATGSSAAGLHPVRAENPIHGSDQQSCPPGAPAVKITHHVPEVRLPVDHAGRRMAPAVPAREDVEDRRDLDPAPPAHNPAAAAAAPAKAELGGPGPVRGAAQRDTQSAPPRTAAAGHPGHDPALAPRHHPPPLGRKVLARQEWPASHPAEHPGPDLPAGPREPRMGDTGGSTANWPDWESRSPRPLSGRSSRPTASAPPRGGAGRPGHNSCAPRPRRSWHATSLRSTCSTAPKPASWPLVSTRPGASAFSVSPCIQPGNGPPSKPATS